MFRHFGGAAVIGALLAFAAPAAAQNRASNLFTLSGFVPKFANTPEKLARLRALPAERLVRRTRDGRTVYLYADPNDCVCVYVGTPAAWTTYQNGGPPGYVGDANTPSTPRYNTNGMVEDMFDDGLATEPGAPTLDEYLFGE